MRLINKMFSIVSEGETVRIQLHPEHVIYQAHFPGSPITPGVCIIQMITEILEKMHNRDMELVQITNLKFVQPLSPIETPVVDIAFSAIVHTDNQYKVRGTVFYDETVFTKFSIVYR